MLDFLDAEDPRPRVSYAASFGSVSLIDWDDSQIVKASQSLRRFSAVSVREAEAAGWVQENLGVACSTMPDPTLLLEPARYHEIIEAASTSELPTTPYLLAYVLDSSAQLALEIQRVADERGLTIIRMETPFEEQRRGVEDWLRLVRSADLVITDSFHGSVFSAIFNRPFVAVVNRSRGADRFASLVLRIKIDHRIVEDASFIASALSRPIDWEIVNDRILASRREGIDFLRGALNRGSAHKTIHGDAAEAGPVEI